MQGGENEPCAQLRACLNGLVEWADTYGQTFFIHTTLRSTQRQQVLGRQCCIQQVRM